MKTYRNLCILIIAAMIGGAGCKSNSSSPNGGGTTTLTIPGVGSVFVYDDYQTDTLTGAKIPSTEKFDTTTVIATHISFAGKTNVTQFRENAGGLNVSYMSYEPNGDVSFYVNSSGSPGSRSGWLTVPLASKGQQSFTEFDTINGGVHSMTVETLTYTGATTLTLAGNTFSAYTFNDQVLHNSSITYNNSTDWFDAATGMVLQVDEPIIQPYGYKDRGSHFALISYSIR